MSKLSKEVIVIENEKTLLEKLNQNIEKLNLNNIETINCDFMLGYVNKSPYDIIFIDNPLTNEFLENYTKQLRTNSGRLIMIERINDSLCKGIRITRNNGNINKEILFDVFSDFNLYPKNEKFIF